MIIFNLFAWNENFSVVCSNRSGISAWFTIMKFLHIIVILFLHCFRLPCEMKSRHGLTLFRMAAQGWEKSGKKTSFPKICHTYLTMMKLGTVISYLKEIQRICKSPDPLLDFCWHQHFSPEISSWGVGLFAHLFLNRVQKLKFQPRNFAKGYILDVWVGSECASCCVRDNDLSVNFTTQPYFLIFLVFSGDSRLLFFQFFRFSMKLIHMHYNCQQNHIGKIGGIFQSAPT